MLPRKIAAPALYGFLTFVLASCATSSAQSYDPAHSGPNSPMGPATAAGTAAAASPKEEQDYRDAYTLYSRGAYEAALQRLQLFEKNYPQSSLSAQVHNLHGLSYLLTRRPVQAIPQFQRALEQTGASSSLGQYLLYNLADAQFEAGQMDAAQGTAAKIQSTEDMDKENRIKVHYLKARIDSKKGLAAESARECLMAGKLLLPSTSRDTRTAVATVLDQNLKAITDMAAVEDLYHSYEDSTLADQVLFRLGAQQMEAGAKDKGESNLKILMSRYPDSQYYAQANDLIRGGGAAPGPSATPVSLRDTGPVDSGTVGVLLPMKGKFAKFGARSLQGIELAFRIFNQQEPDSKITLAIEDSGEDAESTVRALNKLVTQHHAVAVIGPLLSKGIDQVTARAQELGVPLISLARHTGVQSDYIFQAGLTLRMQAREIARYAMDKLGAKRFAVVYPRDKVGEESMHRFWDSVEALGGTVTGVESYNPGETDFRQPIDRLSGLYYTDARWRELEELAKQRQLNNIKKRTRRTEQYFSLKPVVDYDAVFIPEEAKIAGQILPMFAYRDVDHVKFLGTSAWASPELASRAQAAAQNAYFLDAFFADDPSPQTRKYVEKYKATFNQDPDAMDALAYDAAHVVESILARDSAIGRADLKDRLQSVKNFPGVTGKLTFQDGQFMRDLKILTTDKQGKIIEAANETTN
jgi:branched-chain amino acid transport system substrate-binding protein